MISAQALVCHDEKTLVLENVTMPAPGESQLLIKTLHSGISVGTEFALIRNRISWGPYPLVTGYQAVGRVESIGSAVHDYKVGDLVYYRANHGELTLSSGKVCSNVSATHTSQAIVNVGDSVAVLPAGVDLKSASLFVMPAVGLHGADKAQPKVGDVVVVIGAGLIGLGVVNALANRGCRVLVTDVDDTRLAMAARLGATDLCNVSRTPVKSVLDALKPGGADAVFECTGLPAQIVPAMELCRIHGTFVYQGNYGAAPYSTQFLPAHNRQLTCHYPCDDGGPDCRVAVLRLMASKALPWSEVITHEIASADAAAFYTQINQGTANGLVAGVINWA
jgi:bacteriochlorophyllide a dehydrogenase